MKDTCSIDKETEGYVCSENPELFVTGDMLQTVFKQDMLDIAKFWQVAKIEKKEYWYEYHLARIGDEARLSINLGDMPNMSPWGKVLFKAHQDDYCGLVGAYCLPVETKKQKVYKVVSSHFWGDDIISITQEEIICPVSEDYTKKKQWLRDNLKIRT